ncbi:MAG: hypothetical protein H7Y00_04030 [Fimbriimonadaceae bacterium]|nr:hypothetical protein [Chitinophagales bacterium]
MTLLTIPGYTQTDSNITQEISGSFGILGPGERDIPSTTTYTEMQPGFYTTANYTFSFGFAGLSTTYFYHINKIHASDVIDRNNLSSITSDPYQAFGMLIGPQFSISLNKEKNNSYLFFGLQAGGFIATLPDQRYEYSETEYTEYLKSKAPGFVFSYLVGYKLKCTEKISIAVSFEPTWENASIYIRHFGTVSGSDNYNWEYVYPAIKFSLINNL